MIPFGPVYRQLRSDMLAVFPEEMTAPGIKGSNFSQWIQNGAYAISGLTPSRISLQASKQDFGESLRRDIEFLVDSCFEQLLEVLGNAEPSRHSPAWKIVGCYYYAYFACQAFSRIVGRPITFLNDVHVAMIRGLAGVPSSIGVGAYLVRKLADSSATQAEFEFAKSTSRAHDAVWKSVFHHLDRLRASHEPLPRSTDRAAVQEFQLLSIITSHHPFTAFVNGGYDWPAEVRYEANYRVGNAYTQLRTPWHLSPYTEMNAWKNVTFDSALDLGKTSLVEFDSAVSLSSLRTRVRLMLDVANFIFAMVRTLQADLNARRATDARWEERRKRFCDRHAVCFAGRESWLFPRP